MIPGDWTVSLWAVLAFGGVAVGLGASLDRRRERARLRGLLASGSGTVAGAGRGRDPDRRRRHRARLIAQIVLGFGAAVRRLARRPPSAGADLRVGVTLLATAVALVLGGWPVAVLLAGIATGWPRLHQARVRRQRAAAVADGLPEVIDLLRVSVDSGLDVAAALVTVSDHHDDGPLAAALDRVRQRIGRGDRLVDAMVELDALGEPARALHDAVVATARYGVPLGPALERAADDARDARRRRREEAVRTLPVKLLFPLVCCTLPALVLLTVVPLLVRSFPSLTP